MDELGHKCESREHKDVIDCDGEVETDLRPVPFLKPLLVFVGGGNPRGVYGLRAEHETEIFALPGLSIRGLS